jgi:hypothetical protein
MFGQGTQRDNHSNQSVFNVGRKAQEEDPEAFRADGAPRTSTPRQQRHTTTHSS